MTWTRRFAAAVALAALLALAPTAAEARRTVPKQFMGVNFNSPIADAPAKVQAAQFPRMAAAGVESARVTFLWASGQPDQNGALDLAGTDRVVGWAAARRVRLLPLIIVAPAWARRDPSEPFSPAKNPKSMRRYVHALVDRYGPKGSFWREHRRLPKLPIRDWQFWNEVHFKTFWTIPDGEDWAKSYVAQLRVFHKAVKERDRHARVVLSALTNKSWNRMSELYRAGARPYFEAAAIHPFTQKPSGVVQIIRYFRKVMKRNHDARTPLFATEISRPASAGRIEHPSDGRLQTNASGMARFLETTYKLLAKAIHDGSVRVSRVYWYTWASEYAHAPDENNIFLYSGLLGYRGGTKTSEKPAFGSYVRTARKLEGCKKGRSGRCR